MSTVSERFTDYVLDIADQYPEGCSSPRAFAENLLEELFPEIARVEFLLALPPGSVLLGCTGTAWVRTSSPTTPWESVTGGGFGSSAGDLEEITTRFAGYEAPFRLVWVP